VRMLAALLAAGCASPAAEPRPVGPPADPHAKRKTEAVRFALTKELGAYRSHCGAYPSTEQGLAALFAKPAGAPASWKGPYLEGRPPVRDAWGRDFAYRSDGRTYTLASAGEDGRFGTDDDIGGTP